MQKKAGSRGQAPSGGRDIFRPVAGRFEPLCELGQGAVCRVDLAKDNKSGNEVALKRLKDDFLGNKRSIQSLMNEAAALSRLDHPGVPKLIDSSLDIHDPYVAMGYMDGKMFSINNLRLRSDVLKASISICSILSSIHAVGVVHKDVKTSNLILMRAGVSLIDFGLALVPGIPDFAAGGHVMVGTPNFIAPEQTYPKARVDRRADIYSLGIILYSTISGRYPYILKAWDSDGMVEAHRFQEAKPLHIVDPTFSPRLSYAILRAIQKNPDKRYQDAEEMADALSDALVHLSDF